MADTKDILIKIDADLGQSTEHIVKLTDQINALKQREAELRVEMQGTAKAVKEYEDALAGGVNMTAEQTAAYTKNKRALSEQKSELAKLAEARKAHSKEIGEESRKIQNTIISTVEYENSLKGMAAKLSAAKDELRAMNMLMADGSVDPKWEEQARQVKLLNDQVKAAEEKYGVYTRNVGNYTESIIDAFGKMSGSAGAIIDPIKGVTLGLQTMSKTPVIAILSLLVTIIQKVVRELKSSEENANSAAAAFAGFKAVGDLLTKVFQGLGAAIGKVGEWLKKVVGNLAENHEWAAKINSKMVEREQIQKRLIEQTQAERDATMRNADDELAVSELRTKAKQKDLYTAQERLDFLRRASSLEEEISKRNYEIAQKKYEQLVAEHSLTQSSTEELNEEAQAYAEMIGAKKSYYDKVRELQEGIQTAQNEIKAENKARIDEEKAQMEEARKIAEEAVKAIRESALSGTEDYEIEKVRSRYAELYRQLKDDANMSAEEQTYYRLKLEEKEAAEIKAIQDATQKELLEAERKRIAEQHAARVKEMEDELQATIGNAQKQYEIRHEYLSAMLADESLNAEQRMQIEKELTQATINYNKEKIAAFQDYAGQIGGIMSSINQVVSGIEQKQVQDYEADNEAKKDSLQRRLDAGIISQEQYDAQTAKLDADLDKKKAEINRKAAIRERALSVFQIGVNTAAAIMKIWAEVPKFDFGVSTGVLTALASAAGLAQIAAVLATPLPQARKGGLVQGATHEAGGVLINTEGDERIISRNPAKAFPELLNLISYIGKSGVPNSGYAGRALTYGGVSRITEKPSDYDAIASAIGTTISERMKDVKIYTAIKDVREADDKYTRIIDTAKI